MALAFKGRVVEGKETLVAYSIWKGQIRSEKSTGPKNYSHALDHRTGNEGPLEDLQKRRLTKSKREKKDGRRYNSLRIARTLWLQRYNEAGWRR